MAGSHKDATQPDIDIDIMSHNLSQSDGTRKSVGFSLVSCGKL